MNIIKLSFFNCCLSAETLEYPFSAERQQLKRELYDIHKVAARFYYEQLQTDNAHNAVEYLNLRQLSPRTRKIFGLGYAPINKDTLYKTLVEAGFSESAILKSGFGLQKR